MPLHNKLYKIASEGREVWIYLRDQHRLIERAKITNIEGNLVTLKYETNEVEIDDVDLFNVTERVEKWHSSCTWEELIHIDSIGSIIEKVASVRHNDPNLLSTDECPELEK